MFGSGYEARSASGTRGNFQILDPLEFLAEFTQHIPPKGAHLIRYYGGCSNKARGMRRKAAGDLHVHDPDGDWESDSALQLSPTP